jgi:hypothetical protein
MDFCSDLIVRTDHGHSSHPDYKSISTCECRAEREGRPCLRRGLCMEAREKVSWKRVSQASFPVIKKPLV